MDAGVDVRFVCFCQFGCFVCVCLFCFSVCLCVKVRFVCISIGCFTRCNGQDPVVDMNDNDNN